MDNSSLQSILNSVFGVMAGILLIPKLILRMRASMPMLIGIYLCLFGCNFVLMLDRVGGGESAIRALIIASLPFALGYLWFRLVTQKNSSIR